MTPPDGTQSIAFTPRRSAFAGQRRHGPDPRRQERPIVALLIAGANLVAGWLITRRAPGVGLGLLVGVIALTSNLYWRLGLGNIAGPLFFTLGVVGALATIRRAGAQYPAADRLRLLTGFTALTVLVATVLGQVRDPLPLDPVTTIRALPLFNAGGFAGQVQQPLIALLGPLLLLLALPALRDPQTRSQLGAGLIAGAVVALVGPLLLAPFADPWTGPGRPGLVGFSQDIHSYGALLLLAVCVALGNATSAMMGGANRRAAGYAGIAAGCLLVLLLTVSRASLLAALLAIGVLAGLLLRAAPRGERAPAGARLLRKLAAAYALVCLLCALLFALPPVRSAARDYAEAAGQRRVALLLREDAGEMIAIATRSREAAWTKAATLIRERPLWGLGPDRYGRVYVEVLNRRGNVIAADRLPEDAHNYYLQFAVAYGLPALACLLALLATVVAVTARAALRSHDPRTRGLLCGLLAGEIGFLFLSLVSHPMLVMETQAWFWLVAALGLAVGAPPPAVEAAD